MPDHFTVNLANLLGDKISLVHKDFDRRKFATTVKQNCTDKSLTQRVELTADCLKSFLPSKNFRI